MTLEKHQQPFLLLDKCVHAGIRRARQHFVSTSCQLLFGYTIPTRMRKPELRRHPSRQGMIGHARTLVDPENLVIPFHSPNAVHVQDRSMSCQARQNSRMAILLCPAKHPGKTVPVGLIRQVSRHRLPAGHDQPIQITVPEIFDVRVAAADVAGGKAIAGNSRQCVERQMDRRVVRRRIKQRNKLAFRRLKRLVGHVVDQADLDTAAGFGVKQNGHQGLPSS